MVHDLSPFLWQISGHFGVRWYGLAYLVGFISAYFLIRWLARRQNAGMTDELCSEFITYCAIGTLVGGRLGYCLFYAPELFLKFKNDFPFWGVLAVNEGGMASHGGILGIVLACMLFAFRKGISRLYLFDLVAVSGPIGVFFGRIANFINGELVGRPCPPDFPLGVKFPSDIFNWPQHDFTRLATLAPVTEKLSTPIPQTQWLGFIDQFRVSAAARSQVYSVLEQIVDEIQHKNVELKNAIAPVLDLRYPSQLFAAVGEGLFVFLVLFFVWRKPKQPGIIAALFIFIYAIVRIADEQFRMPDIQIGFQLFGLTRGQWLSIAQALIGLILLIYWGRRGGIAIRGWYSESGVRVHRRD